MEPEVLLQAANAARPDLISKTASAMALLGKVSPGHAEDLYEEVGAILSHTQEKVAAADWGRFGMGVAGTLAAGLSASIATDLYDAAKRGLTKGTNFKRIMSANPELHAKFKANPTEMRRAFDSVHRYAPEFTADPLVGGNLLNAAFDAPEAALGAIKDIIGARKSLQEAKAKQYSPGHVMLEPMDTRHLEQKELAAARAAHELHVEGLRSKQTFGLEDMRAKQQKGLAGDRAAHELHMEFLRSRQSYGQTQDRTAHELHLERLRSQQSHGLAAGRAMHEFDLEKYKDELRNKGKTS